MAEKIYLDKDEVLTKLQVAYDLARIDQKAAVSTAIADINAIPAADVQPNKKSQWQPPLMGQGKCETYCGRCFGKIMRNSTGIFEETPFCPHCGADMRETKKG